MCRDSIRCRRQYTEPNGCDGSGPVSQVGQPVAGSPETIPVEIHLSKHRTVAKQASPVIDRPAHRHRQVAEGWISHYDPRKYEPTRIDRQQVPVSVTYPIAPPTHRSRHGSDLVVATAMRAARPAAIAAGRKPGPRHTRHIGPQPVHRARNQCPCVWLCCRHIIRAPPESSPISALS